MKRTKKGINEFNSQLNMHTPIKHGVVKQNEKSQAAASRCLAAPAEEKLKAEHRVGAWEPIQGPFVKD